jgi:hypothetical protein
MDELIDQIVRRVEVEEDQARLIVKMVEAYERQHLLHPTKKDEASALDEGAEQDALESLSGRGFLG